MARLIREICQHEQPPANEITEPPAFTVSKQELRGKAIVVVTFSARTLLGGSHQWGKQKQSNRFCFSFNPRTFLFPRTFHVHEMISMATRTTTRECKQKILNSWNRISRIKPLPRKTRRGVQAFSGLWHLEGLLTLLKNLFFSITRARFEILFSFFRPGIC